MSAVATAPRHLTAAVDAGGSVRLHTEVFLPSGQGAWPALLMRTPYGVGDQRGDARRLAGEGFAVVVQDVRGRFGSTGTFDLGASDRDDGSAAVAWVAAQPWCDGRVASRGVSYPAFTQWQALVGRPPALACAAPVMGPAWWRGLDFRRGGAVDLVTAAHWLPRQAAADPGVDADAAVRMFARAFEAEHLVAPGEAAFAVEDALDHPALGRDRLREPWPVEGSAAFEALWRRIFDTPLSGDTGPGPGDGADAPVLAVGGWYDPWVDDAVAAFRHLRRHGSAEARAAHRLVVTPFGHGFDLPREIDFGPHAWLVGLDAGDRWAAEWLLGRGETLRSLAPVTWFVVGAEPGDAWRSADDWPPPGVRVHRLSLAPQGRLAAEAPGAPFGIGFVYDPSRPVPTRGGAGLILPPGPCDQTGLTGGARDDVLSFDRAPLREPLELAGPVEAEIHLSSSAPDTDVTVKLLDVSPDGRAVNICDGILRARWRHGGESPPLTPGVAEPFRLRLGNVGYRIRSGHRLRVDVSSSNFPRYDRNPNTGAPDGSDAAADRRPARQVVHGGRGVPSHVSLPVLGDAGVAEVR